MAKISTRTTFTSLGAGIFFQPGEERSAIGTSTQAPASNLVSSPSKGKSVGVVSKNSRFVTRNITFLHAPSPRLHTVMCSLATMTSPVRGNGRLGMSKRVSCLRSHLVSSVSRACRTREEDSNKPPRIKRMIRNPIRLRRVKPHPLVWHLTKESGKESGIGHLAAAGFDETIDVGVGV